MYYDAHTHLNSPELFPAAEKYIQNFVDAGWKWMVIVWASEEYNNNAIILAKNFNLKTITSWNFNERTKIKDNRF